jgi:hypothetical protein
MFVQGVTLAIESTMVNARPTKRTKPVAWKFWHYEKKISVLILAYLDDDIDHGPATTPLCSPNALRMMQCRLTALAKTEPSPRSERGLRLFG